MKQKHRQSLKPKNEQSVKAWVQEFSINPKTNENRIQKILSTTKKRKMTMKESKSITKDPICGMTVDEATALQAVSDGKIFFFCSDHCRQKFLSIPTSDKPEDKPGNCCG